MNTLLIMRHAKSDWDAAYGSDHDRPLNGRGVKSARVMGETLAAEGLAPGLVVTSTAVRARTTAELAAEAGNWECDINLESRLYGSGADVAIQVASEAPDVEKLMLVGHQPTWSILVSALSGERVDMKTATVAVLEFDEWPALDTQSGRLTAVYQPRDYV